MQEDNTYTFGMHTYKLEVGDSAGFRDTCARCAFSQDDELCEIASNYCTKACNSWFTLKESGMNKQYEYNGKKYILLGDNSDPLHACDRCAFFEDDGTCERPGNDCVGVHGGYFVQKDSNTVHTGEMLLPTDSKERKAIPITSGVLDYFPLAIAEVAKASFAGNQQHHPGEKLFWDKSKSTDHSDCISRHLIDRGKYDSDGIKHSAKLAWRALALLEIELETEKE